MPSLKYKKIHMLGSVVNMNEKTWIQTHISRSFYRQWKRDHTCALSAPYSA